MLDSLIYKTLESSDKLAGMLAQYDGQPAIFYQQAPQDTDKKWGKIHYPMAIFSSDDRYNPERKSSGVLNIDVFCTDNNAVGPDDISPVIVEILSELFLTGKKTTICVVWNRTDSFTSKPADESNPVVTGNTVSMDILEFPLQVSTNPDPVLAIDQWTKAAARQSVLIGYDDLPESFRPTDTQPAVYWRTAGAASVMKNTYAVAWLQVQLVGHIFSQTPTERQRWLKAFVDELALQGEISMPDGSPMTISRIAYNTTANPLIEGQITITATYGVLRSQMVGVALNNIIKQ